MEELDPIFNEIAKEYASSIIKKGIKLGGTQYNKLLVDLQLCFNNYIKRTYKKCSTLKTLLYRDRPVDFKKHYVPTNLTLDSKCIPSSDIPKTLIKNKKNIFTGIAGTGKSMLLKNLFLHFIDNRYKYIPILVELRLLITPNSNYSILEYIEKILSDINNRFTNEQLTYGLKKGKFILLLDGFDEIDYEIKSCYEREILDISSKYPEIILVLSSRPDDCFIPWEEFYLYSIANLTKEQAIDLIDRIEYDKTLKNKFISELDSHLFEKHIDFLSNPLLLTMMLLTFEQLAEIPEKIHIFYDQAFDTLYHKHDAQKSLYKRKTYCELPIDEFKKVFSTFCIITYFDKKYTFEYKEIISYIEKAIEIESSEINPVNFLNDLRQSVCVIQKDGNQYTFSHRSFQEYFSALFISRSSSINTKDILERLMLNLRDNVVTLSFELDNEKIEKEWILPLLKEMLEKENPLIKRDKYIDYLALFCDSVSIIETKKEVVFRKVAFFIGQKSRYGCFASYLNKLYPSGLTENAEYEQKIEELDTITTKLFSMHTNISENSDIPILSIKNSDEWLPKTWIPIFCKSDNKWHNNLYNELTKKYNNKERSLAEILLKNSQKK